MWFLAWIVLAVGCFGERDLGGQEGSASPSDDAEPAPSLTGFEVFRFRLGSIEDTGEADQGAAPLALNCDLMFSLTASENQAEACEGCALAFTVSYGLNSAKSSDDGLCEKLGYLDGFGGVYAYHPDYEDYGPSWLLLDDDTWVLRGAAALKDDQLTYDYRVEDAQTYYSYSRSGNIGL